MVKNAAYSSLSEKKVQSGLWVSYVSKRYTLLPYLPLKVHIDTLNIHTST